METKESFINFFVGSYGLGEQIIQLETEINRKQEQIERISNNLMQRSGNIIQIQERIQTLEENGNGELDEKILAKEFENICKLPHVERVEIEDEVIIIYTGNIRMKVGIRRYNLGKFKITIWIYQPGRIKIYSLTYPDREHPHPHIHEKSSPCLGNLTQTIHNYMVRHEHTLVVQLMIEFLQTYTRGSSYKGFSWVCYLFRF